MICRWSRGKPTQNNESSCKYRWALRVIDAFFILIHPETYIHIYELAAHLHYASSSQCLPSKPWLLLQQWSSLSPCVNVSNVKSKSGILERQNHRL